MSAIVFGTFFFLVLWVLAGMVIGEYVSKQTADPRERIHNKQY
jgi:hypothetical protein